MRLATSNDVLSTRNAYGETLVELGKINDKIFVLDADLSQSTMTCMFAKSFPKRFMNMGIAEQDMMGVAAGMATCGLIPVVSTFSVFACLRACEPVRTSVAYPKLNVKIITTHSGLSIGTAGATHFCEEDIALMRAIPNMTVIAPSDYLQTKKAVAAALSMEGPVYIRLGRGEAAAVYEELDDYEIGKSLTLSNGDDVTIITTGVMLGNGILAADGLNKEGISCRLIDMHTIKPLDRGAVKKAALETKVIITLEEHNIFGGLGSAVSEVVAGIPGTKAYVEILGIPDVFGEPAPAEMLREKYNMSPQHIVQLTKRIFNRF
jgi:transketolase